jgi:hypothetical protein
MGAKGVKAFLESEPGMLGRGEWEEFSLLRLREEAE